MDKRGHLRKVTNGAVGLSGSGLVVDGVFRSGFGLYVIYTVSRLLSGWGFWRRWTAAVGGGLARAPAFIFFIKKLLFLFL